MSTNENFESNIEQIHAKREAILKQSAQLKRALAANDYKLNALKMEEISLYKKHGQKAPKELTHPEVVALMKNVNLGKTIVKDKYDELSELIKNKGIDKEFFKSKYEEYLAMCIAKGVEVKSSEEIKKVVESLNNFKEEIKEVSLYDILNRVSKEVESKTQVIKKSLKEYDFASKIDFVVAKFFPHKSEGYTDEEKEKYIVLFQWAQTAEALISNPSITTEDLYASYKEYISTNKADLSENLIFSAKGNEFMQAVEKYKNIQVAEETNEHLGV